MNKRLNICMSTCIYVYKKRGIQEDSSDSLDFVPTSPLTFVYWNHEILLSRLAHHLRNDFDLLPAREEVAERHTSDSRHFNVVVDAHQLVHESQREVRVLHAVPGVDQSVHNVSRPQSRRQWQKRHGNIVSRGLETHKSG